MQAGIPRGARFAIIPEIFGKRQLTERRLDGAEWLVLVLDGKTFAADSVVMALGVTRTGEKHLLWLVQTASENSASVRVSCASSDLGTHPQGTPT